MDSKFVIKDKGRQVVNKSTVDLYTMCINAVFRTNIFLLVHILSNKTLTQISGSIY